MVDNMTHQRIPQTAAAFFAEQLGISPLHPVEAAETISRIHMTDYPGALVSGQSGEYYARREQKPTCFPRSDGAYYMNERSLPEP